jgi:hypothetical protein
MGKSRFLYHFLDNAFRIQADIDFVFDEAIFSRWFQLFKEFVSSKNVPHSFFFVSDNAGVASFFLSYIDFMVLCVISHHTSWPLQSRQQIMSRRGYQEVVSVTQKAYKHSQKSHKSR